ncbi:hypothetical protein D2962_14220 [Biomaibacter acetigenes]|uniref:Uncharacterized protein n=1 Tax=Biomaibacter acetigenes TaxID=2316383 RepID=A0A3G2R832_9FIRM|nr:hypothetical protein [Biomaibacter acetigenes]AYO31601.1 hypothetical protein D2962_14220 [Biomaibacter acetigenes]
MTCLITGGVWPEKFDAGQDVILNLTLRYNADLTDSQGKEPETLDIIEYSPVITIYSDREVPVWEKALPALKGTLKPGEYYNIKLAWNQTDFSGKPVPPGGYGVFLKPGLIHYADSCGDNYFQVVHDTMTTQTGLTVDSV